MKWFADRREDFQHDDRLHLASGSCDAFEKQIAVTVPREGGGPS